MMREREYTLHDYHAETIPFMKHGGRKVISESYHEVVGLYGACVKATTTNPSATVVLLLP